MPTFAERRALDAQRATNVAPPPPMPGGQAFTSVAADPPAAGGGSWRPLSDARKADLALATKKKTGGYMDAAIDAAAKRQGLRDATAPGGGTPERAKPQQALDQERAGNYLAYGLAGAGVLGTAIAFARGGAWWVSVLLLPGAGVAYYLTRYKSPAGPVTS